MHLFPDRLFDAIWKSFVRDYGWDVVHHLYTPDCLTYLRAHGVGPIIYSNYAHKAGIARSLNDWNRRMVDQNDDLYCFAAFHPDDADGLSMAAELLEHPKILGFKLQLLVQRFYPWDERLFPLYECVMQHGKRILFHTGTGPVGNEFVGAENFRKLLTRYPDLSANIAHMGGLEYNEFFALLQEHPGLYLDTAFAYLPGLGKMCTLDKECLLQIEDRILYGSDFPNILFPREDEISTLLALDLPQSFYDKVFWENGLSLLPDKKQRKSRKE